MPIDKELMKKLSYTNATRETSWRNQYVKEALAAADTVQDGLERREHLMGH